jgi:hypothetical protein
MRGSMTRFWLLGPQAMTRAARPSHDRAPRAGNSIHDQVLCQELVKRDAKGAVRGTLPFRLIASGAVAAYNEVRAPLRGEYEKIFTSAF